MKQIFKILLFCLAIQAFADYPVVSYRHLADPGALSYNGRVYLYCSNDDDNVNDDGYEMHTIVCVSSSDLKNWTDHGVVFRVPEGAAWAQNSWAPSPAERNGQFYLYFGNGASGIGVAVADNPAGPFTDPIGQRLISTATPGVLPAENMWLFDPMAYVDDDGQAYLYFGGNGEDNLRVIRLNEDMISVDGAATTFHVPFFFEAAWMHKHEGNYYFTYSTNPANGMRIDYMVSDNPTSGFTYGGVLSPQPPNNNNNNHQAIFKLDGQWYQAYHNRFVAQQNGIPTTYKRNLCLDQFSHNEDGSIKTMVNTRDGLQQIVAVNPYERVEAETMNDQSGIETDVNQAGGMHVTSLEDGDWIRVRGVNFGQNGPAAFSAVLACESKVGATKGASLEIRTDDVSGTLIGTVPVSYTGGAEEWKTETAAVSQVTGEHDVYFVISGENVENLFNFDSWTFIEKSEKRELLSINASLANSQIDTVSGNNTTIFKVTAIYSDGSTEDVTTSATFSFDKENIVSITDSLITGQNYGEVTVTFSHNDITDSVIVIVKNRESELTVDRLYTNESEIILYAGTSIPVQVFAEFSDGHVEDVTEKATFDNPKPEVVSISEGVIQSLAEGEVLITVSYQGAFGDRKTTTIHVIVNDGYAIWLEAECGEVGDNWNVVEDDDASIGRYVTVKSGTQSLDQAPSGAENLIELPYTLGASGSFSIYVRINCPSYDDDSFWVQSDDDGFNMYNGLVTSGWEWVKLQDVELDKGDHTITVGYREDGAKMDKLVITNYPIASDGMGEEAANLCSGTGISESESLPDEVKLKGNYPNPFNPTTTVGYSIPSKSHVKLIVYNMMGQQIDELVNTVQQPGNYNVSFDASGVASGLFFYRLEAGGRTITKKMSVLK